MVRPTATPLTYRSAGVDMNAADDLIAAIKPIAEKTKRPGCLGGLGGFGALFEIPTDKYRHPILVSGTDGVGTKLKLAIGLNKHDTVGIDLVAMCANDILVHGAEPMFFLDYFATGKLDVNTAEQVIKGIGLGCEMAGAALVGGETAEMPGMYPDGEYDLAGFCVGAVEKNALIDGSKVTIGDVIVGLSSSGPHSNGYSLIRKIIDVHNIDLQESFENLSLGEVLLTPTHIYVKPILQLMASIPINAIAHITGGGLPGNVDRVLPKDSRAVIDTNSWQTPTIFSWLQEMGHIPAEEMFRTFNCGIGMVIIVHPEHAQTTLEMLSSSNLTAQIIGTIESHKGEPTVVIQ